MELLHSIRRPLTGTPRLHAGQVHIFRVCLDQDISLVETLYETLSEDERRRAGKYRQDRDQDRFVVARGTLRTISGCYLGIAPARVRFDYNRYGKPSVDARRGSFRFNVAHSHGLAVIAVARDREVGVDIEFIDKSVDVLKTAKIALSPAEVSTLQALAPELQADAFFRCWTLKEAYLKAVGTGFGSFPKPHAPGPVPSMDSFEPNPGNESWTIRDLPVDRNYKAALAIEGQARAILYHQLGRCRSSCS